MIQKINENKNIEMKKRALEERSIYILENAI